MRRAFPGIAQVAKIALSVGAADPDAVVPHDDLFDPAQDVQTELDGDSGRVCVEGVPHEFGIGLYGVTGAGDLFEVVLPGDQAEDGHVSLAFGLSGTGACALPIITLVLPAWTSQARS